MYTRLHGLLQELNKICIFLIDVVMSLHLITSQHELFQRYGLMCSIEDIT